MSLRNFRWAVAGLATVVAVCSSPARSRADVQILVEELSSGSVVANSATFTVGTPTGSSVFFQSFNYSSPDGFFSLSGTVGTNSPTKSGNASLSTSFTGGFGSTSNPPPGDTLRIVVTDDNFTGVTGPQSNLTDTAGASKGVNTNAAITVTSASTVLDPGNSAFTAASSTTAVAGGGPSYGTTPTASDSIPPSMGTNQSTQTNLSGLPDPFAIQQVINISFTQTGGPITNQTFGGTAGAQITAVPAPAGLALALMGVPLVGVRRALRKRAVTV